MPDIVTSSRGDVFVRWGGPPGKSRLNWARRAAGEARFVSEHQTLHGDQVDRMQLYPGTRGSMLAAVEREHGDTDYWQLFTYGGRG